MTCPCHEDQYATLEIRELVGPCRCCGLPGETGIAEGLVFVFETFGFDPIQDVLCDSCRDRLGDLITNLLSAYLLRESLRVPLIKKFRLFP